MQELRLVAVSEDGTYLVLATAGRGTRFTLPVDDRLRAAVRGNFSRLGQYEIEVESPLRPKEIQARIRAGETAEEIAATAGIPVERVRWFEGPVLQEREYMAQQAQRCAVRLPGDSAPGPTLGDLVAERLTRRGVPADEIDWDSAKRDDNLWRIKLGFVWNGHTRRAEWIFDPRRRHITPHDEEAMRLSAGDYVEPVEDSTVTPFVPRVAKLAPVPPLTPEPLNQPPVSFPSVLRPEPPAPARPAHAQPEPPAAQSQPEPPAAYTQPPMPPLPPGYDAPRATVPPLRAPDSAPPYEQPIRTPEAARAPELITRVRPPEHAPSETVWTAPEAAATREPVAPFVAAGPLTPAETAEAAGSAAPAETADRPEWTATPAAGPATGPAAGPDPARLPLGVRPPEAVRPGPAETAPEPVTDGEETVRELPSAETAETAETAEAPVTEPSGESRTESSAEPPAEAPAEAGAVQESPVAVPAARLSLDERAMAEKAAKEAATVPAPEPPIAKPVPDKPVDPPKPAPARPAKKARGRRASVPTWDEIMFGARRQD
ncbi:septation protein SepH [Streptosporangium sp. NPDC051022]|uniref:septation protein SepH n=1 Tax=Streptosporangium sp. NPDC051022 TaxID=3155752 RepID=UPI003444DF23